MGKFIAEVIREILFLAMCAAIITGVTAAVIVWAV